MRYVFLFLVCSLAFQARAQQDPIVVKTLTFDSITTRRGFFDFPDASQSWRKILMVHTLKCDPATTQDGYDCGEWDYLTYNKVYDHTGDMDSTALTHPFFLEGLTATESVDLLSTPIHDRQVVSYDTPVVQQVGTSMTSMVIPSVADQVYIPLSSEGSGARLQAIFTVQELTDAGVQPGPIHQLVWLDEQPDAHFFLTVRIGQTAQAMADQVIEEDWTTVLARPWSSTGQVDSLLFSTPYIWDGASNLVVDMAFDRADGSSFFSLQGGDASLERASLRTGPDGYLEFDGNAYLTLPQQNLQQLQDQITICFWARGDDAQPQNSSILEGLDEKGQRVLNIHYPWSNGQIYWDAGDGPNYDRINKQAVASDYKNIWTHWAFVKNASTGSMKIYRNGQLWHSGNGLTRTIQTVTQLVVGRALSYNGPYRGAIDELMVFDKELPADDIRALMQYRMGPFDPNYPHLLYGCSFDHQGSAYSSLYNNQLQAIPLGPVAWHAIPATDIRYAEQAYVSRPTLGFVQGDYDIMIQSDTLHTLHPHPLSSIVTYTIQDHQPIGLDTIHGWPASWAYVIDMNGIAMDSVAVSGGQSWTNYDLNYFSAPFEIIEEYEIGRYITPYGIGLSLGDGFSWVYDVTDYAPILHDQVELSAGNQQELIDLTFLFYPGTPAREVRRIEKLWGGLKSHSYKNLDEDVALPPTTVDLDPEAVSFKVKSRITGHGHNSNDGNYPHCCEWKDNTHTLYAGTTKVADWHVWQTNDCALNPVFPQGGTWPGAREGWCPGDKVKEHEYEITEYINGPAVTLDYRITPVPANNTGMGGGNYVMDWQLIQYGPWAHQVDAEVYDIVAPTTDQYYGRLNPVCHDPQVVIRNTGEQPISSILIEYGVAGGDPQLYTWTGNLTSMQKAVVKLPVPSSAFWVGDGSNLFSAQIKEVNSMADDYSENDEMEREFFLPKSFKTGIRFRLKTNNRPAENSVRLWDAEGTLIFQQSGLEANKQYDFKMDYPDGCYTLELLDTGNDGLSYWADPAAGNGYMRVLAPTIDAVLQFFEPEFGRSIRYSFVLGNLTSQEDVEPEPIRFSVGPNPAVDRIDLDVSGRTGLASLSLIDAMGRTVIERKVQLPTHESIILPEVTSGVYWLRLRQEDWQQQEKVVIQRP